jgi:2-polyprenyl-3-methyl-5-hydroxy-6-metoxy-1,4-benzoquinol methylase
MPKETSQEREYLDAIRLLSFEQRAWTPEAIEEMRDFLGPWNHNIRLARGIYTAYCEDWYPTHEAIMNVIECHLGGGFSGKRVLDIGCLEGYFSLECALGGADALGIDAKEINVKKCQFAKEVLGVDGVQFELDDAMNVTRDRYGSFDVILALGLLYHLDDPFTLLAQLQPLCEGFLLLDTLVALKDGPQTIDGWRPALSELREFPYQDKSYRGRLYREYRAGVSEEERALSTTASHKNDLSVWLTEDSLVDLLSDVGFRYVEKVAFPHNENLWWSDPSDGRVLYVAWSGRPFRSHIFDRTSN